MKIGLFVKFSSTTTVNAIFNALYYFNNLDYRIELFIIGVDKEEIEYVINYFDEFKRNLVVKPINLYSKKDRSIVKLLKYSTSYYSLGIKKKTSFDKIVFFGDSSLFHKQIFKKYRADEVIFWMLELPLMYTNYYSKMTRVILSSLETSLVRKSSILILPNTERKNFLLEKKKFQRYNLQVVSNYPRVKDLLGFNEIGINNLSSTPYICFTGYIALHTLPLLPFLEATEKLYEKYNISLYLAGKTDKKCSEILKHYSNKKFLRYFSYLDSKDIYNLQMNSILGIATYLENSDNHRLCAPQKLYEYLNLGIPVICSNNQPLENLVSNNNLGLTIETFTATNIFHAVESIYLDHRNYVENVSVWKRKTLKQENILSEIERAFRRENGGINEKE
jgi:hypothetical protein